MRLLLITLLINLYSCSIFQPALDSYAHVPKSLSELRVRHPVEDSIATIANQPKALQDTLQQHIIVNNYNVIVPKQEKKRLMSDETIRMAISGFYSTLIAIFTLIYVDQNSTQ